MLLANALLLQVDRVAHRLPRLHPVAQAVDDRVVVAVRVHVRVLQVLHAAHSSFLRLEVLPHLFGRVPVRVRESQGRPAHL